MSTKRTGILVVSLGLLDQWLNTPPRTYIRDVRGGEPGTFEVLLEGDAIPETREDEETPRLVCTVTQTAPKVEYAISGRKA